MAKTWAKSESLVEAHIRGVSVAAIRHHLMTFREFIGHSKSGIYVLRKDSDVYYVGLASSLRKRLADHLDDHHRKKWEVKYLKELETLLIRVSKPRGNKTDPDFIRHKNITKRFKQALDKETASFFTS